MSDLKWYSGEKVYGGTTLFPANRYFLRNGQFIDAYYHDAIVADKDKIIADLKRQLEDVRDNAFEEAAFPGCQPVKQLTEEDVRRVVCDELDKRSMGQMKEKEGNG